MFKDVFTIEPTNKLKVANNSYIRDDEVISPHGTSPYIAAISTNNGIKGYSEYSVNNEGNVITLSTTADSSNTIFYQQEPFIGRQQIVKISIKDGVFNKRTANYIIAHLKKQTSVFNYGNKLTVNYLNNMIIRLPIDNKGDIDWDYIERFIANVEYTERVLIDTWVKRKKQSLTL